MNRVTFLFSCGWFSNKDKNRHFRLSYENMCVKQAHSLKHKVLLKLQRYTGLLQKLFQKKISSFIIRLWVECPLLQPHFKLSKSGALRSYSCPPGDPSSFIYSLKNSSEWFPHLCSSAAHEFKQKTHCGVSGVVLPQQQSEVSVVDWTAHANRPLFFFFLFLCWITSVSTLPSLALIYTDLLSPNFQWRSCCMFVVSPLSLCSLFSQQFQSLTSGFYF